MRNICSHKQEMHYQELIRLKHVFDFEVNMKISIIGDV